MASMGCFQGRFLFQLQSSFFPDVDIGDEQNSNEDNHRDESKNLKLFEDYSPRIEEDHLNIKKEKKHCDNIILNGYSPKARTDGSHSTFIRCLFYGGGLLLAYESGGNNYNKSKSNSDGYKNEDGKIFNHHEALLLPTENTVLIMGRILPNRNLGFF